MLALFLWVLVIVLAIALLFFFTKALIALVLIFAGLGLWNMGGVLGYAGAAVVLWIGWVLVQNDVLP